MSRGRVTTIATTALSAVAIGLAALSTEGTAAASSVHTGDEAFLTQMQSLGIAFPSAQDAVRAGHQVCTDLAAGQTRIAVTVQIFRHTNLTPPQAANVVTAAIDAYCPQFSGQPA